MLALCRQIDVEMQDANGVRMITKPVASRPSRSFRSFPESSLAPLAEKPIAAVEFKTVAAAAPTRFRSASNYDCAAKAVAVMETRTNTVLKPTAKPVSRATASLLSNLGSVGSAERRQPAAVLANNPSAEKGKQNLNSSVQRELNRELDARNRQQTRRDRPSCDGYNWRKYGQKQVKGSEYPRSYYKCTHPACPVKKKVERSFDGQIAEIVYKSEHNHPKPRPPKRLSSGSQEQSFVGAGAAADENSRETGNLSWSAGSPLEVNPKKLSRMPTSSVQVHLPAEHRPIDADCGSNADQVGGATIRVYRAPSRTVTKDHDVLIDCKRRKIEVQISGTNSVGEDSTGPHSVIQTSIECNTSGDGYHWRKYGQKVMKGNSYPRSYYKCTSPKCNVRKYTERAFDDSDSIVTIYEGKHDHEMPPSR